MSKKPKGLKHVILNVYGGESLYHPEIVEILKSCKDAYAFFQDKWKLTITTTTNAIIPDKKMSAIIDLVDEFTCSFHSESSDKQKILFRKNLLKIRDSGRRVKCIVLMHSQKDLFQESLEMIEWCKKNGIKHLPRQLDDGNLSNGKFKRKYDNQQIIWFDKQYKNKSYNIKQTVLEDFVDTENTNLSAIGRACCGGRQLCISGDRSQRHFFIKNHFPDWYCSVDEFFLYIKQVQGEIYVNKDCMMNHDGDIGPIGRLSDVDKLLESTTLRLENNDSLPIRCKKSSCYCGLCAPKAKDYETFKKTMELYRTK